MSSVGRSGRIGPNLALIGAGYWGKNLARNFYEMGTLHTVCDQSIEILGRYERDYEGLNLEANVESIWENQEITRIAIAAPAAFHFELARTALAAGKDVLVEKPVCLDFGEASKLVNLAEGLGRTLMVGHLLQYHPCVEKIQALVAAGELGKLHYISSNRLNLGKIRTEENALWSFAPHDLSVILSLAGNALPESVRCVGGSYLTPGVVDTTMTTIRFPENVRAHVYVSWLNPFKEQKLTVVGSSGMLVFDDTKPWSEKLILYRDHLIWANGRTPTPKKSAGEFMEVANEEPLRRECQHFIDCCDTGAKPRTDGREGLRVLSLLQAAQMSLEQEGESSKPETASSAEGGGLKYDVGDFKVHPTAVVDDEVGIGKGTKVWHFCHLASGAVIGNECVLGQNVMVDGGARIGNRVKIQNNVSVYSGLTIEDDVFLGPSCVLTNVSNPRSQINRQGLYEKTLIRRGATIGANATIVPGVTLGRYSFVSAGAVVTKDVPDYALMKGVPAKKTGWMSRHGHQLQPDSSGQMVCPESGFRYEEEKGTLRCLDVKEEESIPPEKAKGSRRYRHYK
jgi:UDP-2-acetamido-3-amino-2,3-dideoxy-glucuronate N-acetyltransferase